MRQASRLGLGGRVSHLGYLKPEQLAAVYRSAEAMLFPSLYEGFGSPPLEAMACGCPVASSGRASLAEVCGDAALTFDPEDAEAMANGIRSLASDDEVRAQLRERGRARAARFDWDAAARGH